MNKSIFYFAFALMLSNILHAQNLLTPELLWKLNRVSGLGISKDKKFVVYNVSTPNIEANKSTSRKYFLSLSDGKSFPIVNIDSLLQDQSISPDGKYQLSDAPVKIKKIRGEDLYTSLTKSNAYIYESLNNRHWDTWEDGAYAHLFVAPMGKASAAIDIMKGEAFDCPQKPHGGAEDFEWNPNGKELVYVCKKLSGKAYAQSTNTDLYLYTLETAKTKNITKGMMGYDMQPAYNEDGSLLAWTSMRRDGFEADKNDLYVMNTSTKWMAKLTGDFDETVSSFKWKAANERSIPYIKKSTERIFKKKNKNYFR